jgi:ribosomal protein L22
MHLHRAVTYLKNVIAQKEIIPFRRFAGGVGRHAQVHLRHGLENLAQDELYGPLS